MNKWWVVAFKGALSVMLIAYLMSVADLGAALARLRTVSPVWVAGALAVLYLQGMVYAVRWAIVLRMINAPAAFVRILWITFIGLFFNQTLPSTLGGDAARTYYLHREGRGVGVAVKGVMLERLTHFIGALVLITAGQPWLFGLFHGSPVRWAIPLTMVALLVALGLVMRLDRLPAGFKHWSVVQWLGRLAEDARWLLLSWRRTPGIVALSVLGHLLIVLAIYLIAVGLAVPVSLADCLVLVPPVIMVTALPVSIAGWGVREGALITSFGLIGIAAGSTLVVSLIFGLVAIGQGVPGGIMWIATRGRRPQIGEFSLDRD